MLKYICGLILIFCSTCATAEIVDRIAAMVNDEVVTLSDMNSFRQKLKNGGNVDELLIPDEKTKEEILASDQKLLNIMIDERLLDYEIRKQNLTATIERVEQEIRNIANSYRLSQADFKQALQRQGTTMAEYQDMIKARIERQSLIDKAVTQKVKISDDDVTAYYLAKKHGVSSQVYEYTLADIMFRIDPTISDSEAVALERAKYALHKIKENNQSYESVAAESSESAHAINGGILGTFKSGEMLKEFDVAVTHMEAGEVSGIIKARGAFHILKVVDKKLVPDPELERQKDEIRKILSEQAYKKQFQFWLDQKRQEAYIRKNI